MSSEWTDGASAERVDSILTDAQQLLRPYYLREPPRSLMARLLTTQRGLGYSGDRVLLIQGISGAFGVIWVFLFM